MGKRLTSSARSKPNMAWKKCGKLNVFKINDEDEVNNILYTNHFETIFVNISKHEQN